MRIEIDPETFAPFIYKDDRPIPFMVLSDSEQKLVIAEIEKVKKEQLEAAKRDSDSCPF